MNFIHRSDQGRKKKGKEGERKKKGEGREKYWRFREELMSIHLGIELGLGNKGNTCLALTEHIPLEKTVTEGIILNTSTYFIGFLNLISVSRENSLLWIIRNKGAKSSVPKTWQTHS